VILIRFNLTELKLKVLKSDFSLAQVRFYNTALNLRTHSNEMSSQLKFNNLFNHCQISNCSN